MHKKGAISDSIMAEEEKKKIKDVKGFVDYIYPRFVLFGASVSIISAVSLVSDTIVKIPYWTFAQMILFIVVLLFFSQQFKRSCLPDGPKVGSVGLSPRGDWDMPSDAWSTLFASDIN